MGSAVTITPDAPQVTITPDVMIGGKPVNLTTGQGADVAAASQAERSTVEAGRQMHGQPSYIYSRPEASIAKEEAFEGALTSPVPSAANAPSNVKAIAQGAEKLPAVAGALSMVPAATAAIPKIAELFPSTQRAGEALQDVKATAGAIPIDTSKAGNTALDLYEQSQRGAVLPKAVRQFVMRATDPEGEPITYQEAKDFQSNISRLSANERMNLNANTKRLVGQLNADLKGALEDAADTVGKGEQFTQAMQEYHNAMKIKGMTEEAKDLLWKAAFSAAGMYGARKIWEAAQ